MPEHARVGDCVHVDDVGKPSRCTRQILQQALGQRTIHIRFARSRNAGAIEQAHWPAGRTAILGEHFGPAAHGQRRTIVRHTHLVESLINPQRAIQLRLVNFIDADESTNGCAMRGNPARVGGFGAGENVLDGDLFDADARQVIEG
jgi:hypothetical protein